MKRVLHGRKDIFRDIKLELFFFFGSLVIRLQSNIKFYN